MFEAIGDFLTGFEGNDLWTFLIAVVSALIALGAVLYSRAALRMKEMDRQAFFEAYFWTNESPQQEHLILHNIGDAPAYDATATFDFDQSRVMGPIGFLSGPLNEGCRGRFLMRGHDRRHDHFNARPTSVLVIEWTDRFRKVRRQHIDRADFGTPPRDDDHLLEPKMSTQRDHQSPIPDPSTGRASLREGRTWPSWRKRASLALRQLIRQGSNS